MPEAGVAVGTNADHNKTVSENGFVSPSRGSNALSFSVGPDASVLHGATRGLALPHIKLLKPRRDFAGEHADAVHGVTVLEELSLAHDQQVAVPAGQHLIGSSSDHGAGLDGAFDGGRPASCPFMGTCT
jgi:hypothetical protein